MALFEVNEVLKYVVLQVAVYFSVDVTSPPTSFITRHSHGH